MRLQFLELSLCLATGAALSVVACGHQTSPAAADGPKAASVAPASAPVGPPAETTGGFDGTRAYKHVEQLVAIGPHPAGSEGIRRAQTYIIPQLKNSGVPGVRVSFAR